MPCYDPPPTPTEKDNLEVAGHIVYVNDMLGIKTPKDIVALSRSYSHDTEMLKITVPMLCGKIAAMNEELLEKIVYNARDHRSRALAEWWEAHQKEDSIRIREALQKKTKAELQEAIAKLTPRERILLGL